MTCTRRPPARHLAREALRAGDGRERVVLAPQRQERHAERGQLPVVGLELGELAAAVELELAAPARLVGERLEVLAGVLGPDALRDRAEHRREPLERHPVDELLALPGRAQRVGHARASGRRRRSRCRWRRPPTPRPDGRTPSAGRSARPSRGRRAPRARGPRPAAAPRAPRRAASRCSSRAGRARSRRSRAGRARPRTGRGRRARRARAATCARTRDSRGRAARPDPRDRRRS